MPITRFSGNPDTGRNAAERPDPRIIMNSGPFVSRETWNEARPRALVVACSDGRVQEHTDEFITEHLGISHYDRLFAPGGPARWRPRRPTSCAETGSGASARS